MQLSASYTTPQCDSTPKLYSDPLKFARTSIGVLAFLSPCQLQWWRIHKETLAFSFLCDLDWQRSLLNWSSCTIHWWLSQDQVWKHFKNMCLNTNSEVRVSIEFAFWGRSFYFCGMVDLIILIHTHTHTKVIEASSVRCSIGDVTFTKTMGFWYTYWSPKTRHMFGWVFLVHVTSSQGKFDKHTKLFSL